MWRGLGYKCAFTAGNEGLAQDAVVPMSGRMLIHESERIYSRTRKLVGWRLAVLTMH